MAIARLIAPYANFSGKIVAPTTQPNTSAVVNMPDKNGRTLVRSYVYPNQPDSAAQQAQRAILTSVSEAMQSLSQPQVEAWKTFADFYNITGRLGLTYKMTWSQAFQRVNNYRVQAAQAPVLTPPSTSGATVPTAITAVTSDDGDPTQEIMITVTDPSPTSGSFVAIRLTRNMETPQRQARDNEFVYPTGSDDSIFARLTSGFVYTITASRINILEGMYIGVEMTVLNSGYAPVGRIVNRNIIVDPN